jgi:transposase
MVSRYRLPIEARDDHQRRILRCLASGEWKAGEVQIERDRLRPAKWYLRISYKRKIPLRTQGQAATIALGMRFFLVAVTADGQQWIYDGADIEAHLRRNQDMRRSYQRGVKASARVGHGRPRALKSIEHLAERSERYRQTRCSVIARRLATWLRERGVSRVYLGQLTDIRNALPESLAVKGADRQQWIWERIQEWPYYRLGQALKSALEMPKEGEAQEAIEVIEIDQDYHSQRCPACGYTAKENRDLGRWKLICHNPEKASRGRPGCGYSRHLDLAQCANALVRASGEAMKSLGEKDSDGLGGDEGEKKESARKPGGKRRK